MSASPIGEMQSVWGAGIFVFWITAYNASASCRPIRCGFERVLIFAASQIFCASPELTRENELVRNWDIVPAEVLLSIVTSWPSSMPYGCGLISTGSGGSWVVDRVYVVAPPSAST